MIGNQDQARIYSDWKSRTCLINRVIKHSISLENTSVDSFSIVNTSFRHITVLHDLMVYLFYTNAAQMPIKPLVKPPARSRAASSLHPSRRS